MSDQVFIGQNAGGLETAPQLDPVTKVILLVDDENYYEAGTDTGRTLEVTCPYGSQAMANSILASLSGYQYQPAQATDALMDPAAEFGDAITVDGVYTVIADMGITFDALMTSDVGAPGQEEIESEYPYLSQQTTEANRKLAETRSLISKTSEEIKLEVENEINQLSASITVQLDNINSQITGLNGQVAEIDLKVDNITLSVTNGSTSSSISLSVGGVVVSSQNITMSGLVTYTGLANGTTTINGGCIKTGTIDADRIDTDELYVNAANITGTLRIGQLPSSVATTSDIPTRTSDLYNDSGFEDAQGVTTIINGTVTTDYVDALGVSAKYLKGQTVYLLNSGGGTIGTMTMTGASSSSYAVDLTSYGALRLTANYGAVYIEGGSGAAVGVSDEVSINGGDLRPANSSLSCGTAAYPWSAVYSNTSTIQTSDEHQKNSIEALPEKYLTMMDHIQPRRYKLNDGTSGRYHPGFVAQEVRAAMDAAGVDATEFGGWCLDHDVDGNEVQMLRMEEFIPILWAKIKALEAKVNG